MDIDLNRRLFDFAIKSIKLIRLLPAATEYKVVKYQLAKSATSSGANYEEAQAASSDADFNYKIMIALREMRESNYWLRILREIEIEEQESVELKCLINESDELKRILGSIAKKRRQK